jgi:hypothetical protein
LWRIPPLFDYKKGKATFRIVTLSIMTLMIMPLRITKHIKMTLRLMTLAMQKALKRHSS